MPRYVCQHEGLYFEWSTIVDAPVTFTMTREEYTEFYRDQYGVHEFEREFSERIARADSKGTSSMLDKNLMELVRFNRAGPEEMCAPFELIFEALKKGEEPSRVIPVEKCRDLRKEEADD